MVMENFVPYIAFLILLICCYVEASNHVATTYHNHKGQKKFLHHKVKTKDFHPHLTKSEAQKIAAIFGGIGPVINPPGLKAVPDDNHATKHYSRRSVEDSDQEENNEPEQIHIAYGDTPSDMIIVWSTRATADAKVFYGKWPTVLSSSATGTTAELVDGNDKGLQWIHRVQLKDLTPGDRYFYKVVSGREESQVFDFFTMKDGNGWAPTLLVYGDLGRIGGAPSLRLLNRAAQQRTADAILHAGDFAYDFHGEGGKVGDDFMNRIQSVAAKIPYMTSPGNHEIPYNFSHYRFRFSMPSSSWPMAANHMWYSFNIANTHIISYSSEVYFTNGPVESQLSWLENDLRTASSPENRQTRPWIIAFGHRPMYCSNVECSDKDREVFNEIEELFFKYGVDLVINGHRHSYERMWPVYKGKVRAFSYKNPTAPVHVIIGTPGCNQFRGVCVDTILESKGEWSAFRSWIPGLYGVGKLFIANATHLHLEQKLAVNEQTLDEFWILQEKHGPFLS